MTEIKEGIVRVVAAVIERDGCFLVCQRARGKRHGGLWEFPGGKMRSGENLQQAATRELEEELALKVTDIGRTLFIEMDPESEFQIEFVEVFAQGEPRVLEHQDLRWLPPEDLVHMQLTTADKLFAASLIG